jgi:tetratricopeptide (TPR) repeat protein
MATVEELAARVEKLEKRRPWRFVFQYLLAPALLIPVGAYFNWLLQETRNEIERIEVAHEIVADALEGEYDVSFVTVRLLPIVLDEALAAELTASIEEYWAKRAEIELAADRPEEAVRILEAASHAGAEVAERVEARVLESDIVSDVPGKLSRAKEAEQLTAAGFDFLAEGQYSRALEAFQRVEEVYPTYGTAREISELLGRNLTRMGDPATETRVLGTITDELSWKAPTGAVGELRERVDR